MSSLIPPEFRKLRSSGSPITIRPPVRACTMLSMPSRRAVPGAIISSALMSPGSGLTSLSRSSPDRGATVLNSRAFSDLLARPSRPAEASIGHQSDSRGPAGSGSAGATAGRPGGQRRRQRLPQRGDLARTLAAACRRDHALQAVLGGLLQTTLGVADPAQLARQPELAEAGPRRVSQGDAAACAGDGERDRQIA